MTKFSVEATPNVGVATASVMWMQRGDDARDHDEVGERDAERGQQHGRQDERVDHAARSRMDRRHDEEPELLQQDRQADDDTADDREFELGEDDVGGTERVQLRCRRSIRASSSG